ncbi:hypothetical protein OB905_13100 [Halobacteria archaeon AArc-dxtr1]|nr:hypothetical protein [Halobacteria archaeon AArc-dxtr1]
MSESARCIGCDGLLPPDGGLESAFSREDGHYCYDCVATPQIALVGCGKAKVELDPGETIAAKDLYTSNYFQLKREYAEECCNKWRILSAEHGLLQPDEEIEAYDASLKPSSDSYIGDYEAGKWSVQTSQSISLFASFQAIHTHYVVLAGEDYVGHIEEQLQKLRHVAFPFRSDDLGGNGDQMGWLREEIDTYHPPGQADLGHYAIADGGSNVRTGGDRNV